MSGASPAGMSRGLQVMEVLTLTHLEDLDVPNAIVLRPDLITFVRLDGFA